MGGTLTLSELEAMAYDLGIDLPEAPVRMTSKRAPARSVQALREFAAEYGEHAASTQTDRSARIREIQRAAETGTLPAHELRDQLREVGIDLGHQREDAEDFESTCRHEAGHAVAAHGLGWHVVYVDARAGETKIEPPEYWEQSYSDRLRQHNAIAAAGSVAAGTSSWRDENLNDRVAVRMKGHIDFKDARKLAAKLLADRWARPALERLTRALLMVGRLEGAALRAVLEDWEA